MMPLDVIHCIYMLTIILITFAGFVFAVPEHLEIFLGNIKMDQYGNRGVIVIAHTDTKCCPGAMLLRDVWKYFGS